MHPFIASGSYRFGADTRSATRLTPVPCHRRVGRRFFRHCGARLPAFQRHRLHASLLAAPGDRATDKRVSLYFAIKNGRSQPVQRYRTA
jgi:hypothetical protein